MAIETRIRLGAFRGKTNSEPRDDLGARRGWTLDQYVYYRPGWSIANSVLLGLGLLAFAVWFYASLCTEPSPFTLSYSCVAVRANPPWTLLTALAATPSAWLTWYWRTDHKKRDLEHKEQDIKAAASAELTSRFAAGVELLQKGAPGALYALEGVAIDSERYHWPVMETIAGYARLTTHPQSRDFVEHSSLIAAQAAIKILGRRLRERDPKGSYLDLAGADLRAVKFNGFNFDAASFIEATLVRADLRGASFIGARFDGCDASGVTIDEQTKLDDLALAGLRQGGAQITEGLVKKLREEREKERSNAS